MAYFNKNSSLNFMKFSNLSVITLTHKSHEISKLRKLFAYKIESEFSMKLSSTNC